MAKTIYTVQESDIPGLYNVGFQGIAGRKFDINKRDYYKVEKTFYVSVPVLHQDSRTGIFYKYQNSKEVERWRYQYAKVKPDLDTAINTKNIIPITNDETEIIKNLGAITNKENIKNVEQQLAKENKEAFLQNRRTRLGQTFGNVGDLITEPLDKTAELAQKAIGDASDNVAKLAGSPSFLIILGVGAIVAIKVIL